MRITKNHIDNNLYGLLEYDPKYLDSPHGPSLAMAAHDRGERMDGQLRVEEGGEYYGATHHG